MWRVRDSLRLPYYFWRGLLAGLVVWLLMSFLVNRLDTRSKQMESNFPVDDPSRVTFTAPEHRTDFGGFLGVIVFALFCVVPGPYATSSVPKTPSPVEAPKESAEKD